VSPYQSLPGGQLDQGDIIRHIVVIRKALGTQQDPPNFEQVRSHVLVLSHGCEIDKPDKPGNVEYRADSVLVARVVRLSQIPSGVQGQVRKLTVRSAFYLPKEDPLPEEAYVDWRSIQPVDKAVLVAARATDQYVCTLGGDLFMAAKEKLWEFFFRDPGQ